MSHNLFEYFFDPEELEPFYSELPQGLMKSTRRVVREVQKTERAVDQSSTPKPRELAVASTGSTVITVDSTSPQILIPEQVPLELDAETVPVARTKPADREPPIVDTPAAEPERGNSEPGRTRVRRLLSVHALGQYVYCVRSAILAAERGDERDIDEPLPRLTYLPNFDREQIEEMLSKKITQLGFFLLYGVFLGILMKMGLAAQNRWVFYPSFLALIGLSVWSLHVFVCLLQLAIRRRAAIRAEAREPEPNIQRIEKVNWWSLLKAGFEPIDYRRPFQHPEFPLEGCPWRVLQRGSRRIPVIKSGTRKLGNKKGELYPKHQVRLAAYALLLEASGHLDVPYGLVFPHDSAHGLAVPITDRQKERVVELLHEFELKLVDSQQHKVEPRLPAQRNRCTQCDYGKPVTVSTREVENSRKAGLQLVVLQDETGDLYRSDCSDRFGSAPPHGLAVRKCLRTIVN